MAEPLAPLVSIPGSLAPQISGDPTVALFAQLNRFRKNAHQPPFQLQTALTQEAAVTAITLLQARLVSNQASLPDMVSIPHQINELNLALKTNPIGYVQNKLTTIVKTLALFGDRMGLDPAEVGITEVTIKKKMPWLWIGLGVLVVGGVGYAVWNHRRAQLF